MSIRIGEAYGDILRLTVLVAQDLNGKLSILTEIQESYHALVLVGGGELSPGEKGGGKG